MTDQLPMAPQRYSLTAFLGDLGVLPFIFLSGLIAKAYFGGGGLHSASLLGLYAPYVFVAYSAVILSFLSGALWERSRLSAPSGLATAAIVCSNLVALSAWASLLLVYGRPIMTVFTVCLLIAGFLSLLWVERVAGASLSSSRSAYWSMRLRVTVLVVVLHALVAALLLTDI